ncbi:MAG: hypothetical protein A2X49_11000 [Lentisphaerae bacterium GWF2_52_8]|nr:MAG: hypothetical protein A2X49_11000 [Lentisphaerae bacterium GWF2_52_8]
MPSSSDFNELKKAYYKRVKECHPDLYNNSAAKTEEFKLLVAAFDVLSDPGKRKRYDCSITPESIGGLSAGSSFDFDDNSIMDSVADDVLEELIVGNNPPEDARLATLFLDLERTLVFMSYREAKNLFHQKRYRDAKGLFLQVTALAPSNILYRYHLARTYFVLGQYRQAVFHYKTALDLGEHRIPPQNLFRIRDELAALRRKRMPWWTAVLNFLGGPEERPALAPDVEMLRSMNRALSKLSREKNILAPESGQRKSLTGGVKK